MYLPIFKWAENDANGDHTARQPNERVPCTIYRGGI